MELSAISYIFIYLLFLRGSLSCYITRPYFLWLRLLHVKAHGDMSVTSLSYLFFKTNEYNVEFIQYFSLFLVF